MGKVKLVSLKKIMCLAVCALTMAPPSARAADTAAVRLLLNRAQAQAQGGHMDIAIATWKQVLASDPNNLEALQGLAITAAQNSRPAEAQAYQERLLHAGASAEVIRKIQAIVPRPSNDAMLREAASLTQGGKYAEAVAIYQKLYGDHPPPGEMALTYYDTLAAIPAERRHAVDELRRLAMQFQGDERYSITLGRVLTYDGPTRAEGLAILQRYPHSQPAQEALDRAQHWDERTPAATPATATSSGAATPLTSEVALGYRALNGGNLSSAESHFQSSLEREAARKDAYAGLGYLRMRQQDFPAAVHAFELAQQNGNHDPKMATALETARFWTLMAAAGRSAESGELDEALAAYRQALVLNPDNVDALNGLGGTLLRAGRPSEAIPYLSRAANSSGNTPQAASAWRNLILAQSQNSSPADAIRTAEHIPAEQRSHLEQDPVFLGALAADYTAAGDTPQAEKLLRQALAPFEGRSGQLTTTERLQYASLLVTARHYNTAALNYQRVLAESPANADAWQRLINAEHQNGRDAEALAALHQMPPAVTAAVEKNAGFLALIASIYQAQGQMEAARTTLDRARKIAPSTSLRLQRAALEMVAGESSTAARLYAQLVDEKPDSVAAWLGWLEALHGAGQDREALQHITAMPEEVGSALTQNAEFLQALASIYTSLGDRRRALVALASLEKLYAERGEEVPPAAALQEGWLLLQSGDDAHLARVLQSLAEPGRLTPNQQDQLAQLWASWSVQRSSQLLRAGNPTAAEAVLAAALRAFPDNSVVNNALAGAYLQNGNAQQAVLLYARQDFARAEEPVCLAAIDAALAANDRLHAEAWLTTALNRFDHNPRVLERAARFEQQRGDRRKAAAYYRAALQASAPTSVDDLLGTASAGVTGPRLSAREALLQMLAPPLALQQPNTAAPHQEQLWPVASERRNDGLVSPTIQSQSTTEDRLPLPLPVPAEHDPQRGLSKIEKARTAKADVAPLPSQADPLPPHASASIPTQPLQSSSSPQSTLQLSADFASPAPHRASEPALPISPASQPLAVEDSPASIAVADPDSSSQLVPLPSLTGKSNPPPPPSPTQQIQQNLAGIESASSSALAGNSAVGFHSGQPGFDRLTIFGAEVEQSVALGMGARLSVITRPVLLESQSPEPDATFQLGSLPLGASPAAQNSAGVGGEVQLRTRSFGAALGYTPYGFLVSNITGRLLIQPDAGPLTFTFERQPTEDSQLSYAGLRDPGSIGPTYAGNVWGGVMANAGSLQMSRGAAASGWYAQIGGQYLSGRHVRNNFRIDGDAGSYWSIWQHPQYGKLTLGMNFFGMHYGNNQRQFTYGNGGYFSPGAYLLSSIPATFDGLSGPRLHYRLVASLGLQAFQEGSAPFFPLDPFLQNSALGGYTPQKSVIGANYNIEGETSYLINEHWHVNGFFSLNNTRGYNNDRVGFSLRYALHPQPLELTTGPTGVGGSRGLRPVVLP